MAGISKPRHGATVLTLVVAIACVHTCASLSSHVVTTAEELQLAIRQKHERIEITEHIDLSVLTDGAINLLNCTTDFTIWGNCTKPRPAASRVYDKYIDVGAIGSNACSILAKDGESPFSTDYDDNQRDPNVAVCGRVWLSNLVISSTAIDSFPSAGVYVSKVELHVVNTVIAGFNRAVYSIHASVYFIDCQVVEKDQSYEAFEFQYDPRNVRVNTTLQMSGTNVTFNGTEGGKPAIINVIEAQYGFQEVPAVTPAVLRVVAMNTPGCTDDCISLSTEETGTENAPIIVSDMLESGGQFKVRSQVTWADVQPSEELALFYKSLLADGIPGAESAMDPFKLAPPGFYETFEPPPLATPPSSPGASSPAINGSDSQPPPGIASGPVSPSTSEPSSSSGVSTGLIAAVIAGVVVLFCVCCIVFVLLRRRRSGPDTNTHNPITKGAMLHHNQSWSNTPADAMDVCSPRKGEYTFVPTSGDARDNGTYSSGNIYSQQPAMLSVGSASNTVTTSTATSSKAWSNTLRTTVALPQGACAAMRGTCNSVREARTVQEGLDFIDDQIATIVQHGDGIVFDRYKLVAGVHQTRRGGQGIVCFAKGRYSEKEFAMKFFACNEAFVNEHELYKNPTLQRILPAVDNHFDTDGDFKDPYGRFVAPCVILEKGEPLDEWVSRVAPDVTTSMTIMTHVVKVVIDLHQAGLVHRDLKPSNTIWLDSRKGFTVIDFGSAAVEGESARMSLSIAYASPEIVMAYGAGQHMVIADRAVDTWSLGIMAWELFTGKRVFPSGTSKEAMMDALVGRTKLPWEDETSSQYLPAMRRLGAMRRGVLGMLHRNPAERMQLTEVHSLWTSIFEGTMLG